jgi:hypothetical protein
MSEENRSALAQAEIYWGDGEPDAKFSPQAWAYYYADPLLDLARHVELNYTEDPKICELLEEIKRI